MLKATQIGYSIVFNSVKTLFDESKHDSVNTKQKKIKVLTNTLSKYGGVLSKIAQYINNDEYDSNIYAHNNTYLKTNTHQYVLDLIKTTQLPYSLETKIFKAGSIGLIYKGIFKDRPICFKIKYEDIEEQTEQDKQILNFIGKYLYTQIDIKKALEFVMSEYTKELNFKHELENHLQMYEIWNDIDFVKIPYIYPELCRGNILISEYVDSIDLKTFIKQGSQEEKNIFGYNLIRFIYENIFIHKLLYADCHYGNFLVCKQNNKLCVIDYGHVEQISQYTYKYLKKIIYALKNKNKSKFFQYCYKLKLLCKNSSIEEKAKDELYKQFYTMLEPFIVEKKFTFSMEWIQTIEKSRNFDLIRQWGFPVELCSFNKVIYSLNRVLCQLKSSHNFYEIFNHIFLF